jgi:hypothetical protein
LIEGVLAATDKYLAQSNKSRTGVPATNSDWQRGAIEHELAPSRPVFFPLSACRSRGVPGHHLRMHPENLQAETAYSRSKRLNTA